MKNVLHTATLFQMMMDHPDEQKNIHVNPEFLSGKNKGQSNRKVHVNPAFLQKSRPVQPNTFTSISSQRQGPYPGYNHHHSSASNISHTNTPLQPRIVENPTRTYFPQSKPPLGTNLYKYERNRTQPHQQTVLFTDSLAGTTRIFKATTGKPPRVPTTVSVNRRHNTNNIRPVQQYSNLCSKKTVITKGSPYSWTASKGPSVDATKSSHTTINTAQAVATHTNTNQNYFTRYTNDKNKPEVYSHLPKKVDSKVPIPTEVSASKGSSILVNPKLLQSITASTSNPLLSLQPRPQAQISLESTASHADTTKPLSKKETPKKTSKFKVISRTKLVRRHSSSGSTEGSLLSLIKKSYPKSCAGAIHQCSPKFPTRARKYSTSSGLKKRYLIKSRTKLVRQLSGSSTSSKDGSTGNTKYSLKTKTKLVRRRSNSSTHQETPKKAEGEGVSKSFSNKSAIEKGAKFSILSKTKLVRRRSSQSLTRSNLLRNNSTKIVRCWSSKACGLPQVRKINNIYKVQNDSIRMSLKQKAAKGIVSKYKINRLKVDSAQGSRAANDKLLKPYLRQKGVKGLVSKYKINRLRADPAKTHFPVVAERNQRYSSFKRRKVNVHSDHIINIGGILYKSTKMSLRKQQAKTKKPESNKSKTDATCIVHLRGDKFQVSAGGRTLKRVTDAPGAAATRPSLSRVHIGGLTYSQTANGQYELTKVHQARAVLSSAKQRSVLTLSQRRKRGSLQKRNEYCIFFNRFGRCSKKEQGDCPYIHDPKRIAICTRFLRGRCPVKKCPFSHVIDPDKMPVCSHFVKATCTRDNCPYRHVRVNPSAPICLEFLQGHCTLGEECKKQHVLRCEEFSTTGTCPRGSTCPLSHHRSRSKRKKSVSLEPAQGRPKKTIQVFVSRKRKVSESLDALGGPTIKSKTEKKARGKTVPKKRYFHVNDVEGNDMEEKSLHAPSDPVSNSQLVVPCVTESFTKPVGSISENHTKQDREEEQLAEPSLVSSRIEETRKRILGKIEKMKQTASNLEMNDAGVLVDKTCEKREGLAFGPSPKPISENEKMEDDSRGILAQRPPLPKRLPSYIPLSMDDED